MKHTTRSPLYNTSSLYTAYGLRHLTLAAAVALSMTGAAYALPQGASVVSGNVTVNNPTATQQVITQTTNKAIVNWQGFDIGSNESVNIKQPSANSVQLNRITAGTNPTQILGSLTANGRVMLVNPNGVFFGTGSQVNVGGLVATTADITNANFNSGNYNFDIAGKPTASIINKGNITAKNGGLVAFVAPGVQNDGVITAKLGKVQLASGKTFNAVDLYGDGLLNITVGQEADAKALDNTSAPLAAAVVNTGTISAQGGIVYLTANAAKEVVDNAINTTGIIEAKSANASANGTIVLDGGEGDVNVSGIVDASGKGTNQTGGTVKVLTDGGDINVAGATIDASGTKGGGNVNIGGGYQGGGSMVHAGNVTVDGASTIDADALNKGNGGKVVVWSDGTTSTAGLISAQGGSVSGNGGTVETSGHTLNASGTVNASAANGTAGTWELDPSNVVIGNAPVVSSSFVDANSVSNSLNTGTNVTVTTNSADTQDGNINVNGNITKNSTNTATLKLQAANDINLNNADITSTFGKLNVVLNSDRDASGKGAITIGTGSSITSNGGNITMGGGANPALASANGSTTAPASPYGGQNGVSIINAPIDAGSGNILINGHGGDNGQNAGVLIYGTGSVKTTSGKININGSAGDTTSYGAYGVLLGDGGNITTQTGNINVDGIGAATSNGYGNGVQLYNSSSIISTGSGNITLNGKAGGPESAGSYGVYTVAGNNTIGGATDTGKININSNDAILLNDATVTTAGNVVIDPTNVTLNNTDVNGKNVTIDPVANVALTGGSTITASKDVYINNTGKFSSDTAGVIKGQNVLLNQSTDGSIQNAVDAVDKTSGATTLTLGNGDFDQTVTIDGHNNFNLKGSGTTVIKPSSVAGATSVQNGTPWTGQSYKATVLAQNASNVNISNLTVDNTGAAEPSAAIAYNNASGNVTNAATKGGSFGVYGVASSGYGHTDRVVNVNNVTSEGASWASQAAIGDKLTYNVKNSTLNGTGGALGMDYSNGAQGTFTNNNVKAGSIAGVSFHGAHDVTINGGTITGSGASSAGIIDEGTAYGVPAATNVTIKNASITNVGTGIQSNGGSNWTVTGNTVKAATAGNGTGINLQNTTGTNNKVADNNVSDFGNGVMFTGTTGTISGNALKGNTTGITVNNSNNVAVKSNTITNGTTGIVVNGGSGNSITNNTATVANGDGIDVTGSNNVTVKSNKLTGNGTQTGIKLVGNTGTTSLSGNTITNFATNIQQ